MSRSSLHALTALLEPAEDANFKSMSVVSVQLLA